MKTVAGSTEIWTRIAGFRVQSANHYTIEPWLKFKTEHLLDAIDEWFGRQRYNEANYYVIYHKKSKGSLYPLH